MPNFRPSSSLVRKEMVQVYTEKENAPNKAANLIRKTKSRRV
jgi:hypothetical protein